MPSVSSKLRARLGHPVIDTDGHMVELFPVIFEYLKQVGGPEMTEKRCSINKNCSMVSIGARRPTSSSAAVRASSSRSCQARRAVSAGRVDVGIGASIAVANRIGA